MKFAKPHGSKKLTLVGFEPMISGLDLPMLYQPRSGVIEIVNRGIWVNDKDKEWNCLPPMKQK